MAAGGGGAGSCPAAPRGCGLRARPCQQRRHAGRPGPTEGIRPRRAHPTAASRQRGLPAGGLHECAGGDESGLGARLDLSLRCRRVPAGTRRAEGTAGQPARTATGSALSAGELDLHARFRRERSGWLPEPADPQPAGSADAACDGAVHGASDRGGADQLLPPAVRRQGDLPQHHHGLAGSRLPFSAPFPPFPEPAGPSHASARSPSALAESGTAASQSGDRPSPPRGWCALVVRLAEPDAGPPGAGGPARRVLEPARAGS